MRPRSIHEELPQSLDPGGIAEAVPHGQRRGCPVAPAVQPLAGDIERERVCSRQRGDVPQDRTLVVVAVAVYQKSQYGIVIRSSRQTGKRKQTLDLRGEDEVVARSGIV